jgi:hypothetical protein
MHRIADPDRIGGLEVINDPRFGIQVEVTVAGGATALPLAAG